ncbi:MAG: folate family ECF transporter S component [Oscillospiraceae bacterium]|nr:folate family ECF transporter S component [Oscillospiraceae bacterium]
MFLLSMFRRSANELKDVRCLAVTGILIAAYIVLKSYTTIEIAPPILRFNFSYIALAAIGMFYGPVVALTAAIPCDLIGAFLRGSGSIMWGLTLVYMFQGLTYGVLLYGFELKKSFWKNAKLMIAQAIVIFISQMVFNTAVLYFYGILGSDGTSVNTLITMRAVKNLIEFPISVALLYVTLVPVSIAYKKTFRGRTT